MLATEDRIELHELIARYAELIDSRQFDRLGEIFTEDTVFEFGDMSGGMAPELQGAKIEGLDAVIDYMTKSGHPAAHLMTNVFVDEVGPVVQVSSRGVFPLPPEEGQVGTPVVFGSYYDKVVRTEHGWRSQHRVFAMHPMDINCS